MLMIDESSTDHENDEEEMDDEGKQYSKNQSTSAGNQGKTEDDDGTTATGSEHESEDEDYEEVQFELDTEDYKGIFTQSDVLCNVQDKADIPSSWILLDSQSTVEVFCNPRMLGNIREAK